MPAKFIRLGEPAHDAERQALRFLVDGLPGTFTVYGNPWVVERSGVVYETDAVVAAPHAIFVVEMKAYRGAIEGTDYDWYTPGPVKSPIGLNRKTAQVLNGMMKRVSYEAGQIWVQGLIFLSAASACNVQGPASRDRIHLRRTILDAIQDPAFISRIASRAIAANTPSTEAALHRVLTSEDTAPKRARPARTVREYEIERALETHDNCKELLAKNTLSGDRRVLRIYNLPPLASDEERERIHKRARWEAQVLGRLGKCEGILAADPPFTDDAGIVLPLEYFESITLATWVERYALTKKADLKARTGLWLEIAAAVAEAHDQGVVHRLLRPEVILVKDTPQPSEVRVTGFDLAKQLERTQLSDSTAYYTTLSDERLRFAAPEVVNAFSTAEPASDQFSLGALLALLVAGRPLFESTRELLASKRLVVRLRDIASRVPLSLDEAVGRMLAMRPPDRFPDLEEAAEAVRRARDPQAQNLPVITTPAKTSTPEDLAPGTRVGADYEVLAKLGQGGMAVVYAVRHLPSGTTRALKIARPEASAEEALRGEHQALRGLEHPNIVHVGDLTNIVDQRVTLVMERVGGETLRHRFLREPPIDPPTRRRYAEDLLAALDYLEQKGVTHKDLKPDNLLVGDGGLTVIDFSLASMPSDAAYGGTALYRDPARPSWTHATDRYAAALCLFELYAGRHAFDGKVPEPGQQVQVRPEDIDPPGLAEYFRKALDPVVEQRFPSAKAMRDVLLLALGAKVDVEIPGPAPERIDSSTSLRATPLPPRAVNQLARAGVATVGELLGLGEAQVRALSNLGEKTIRDILALGAELRPRGLSATGATLHAEPALVPALADSPEPLERLTLNAAVRRTLHGAKLGTIGAVARLSRSQLRAVDGIGPGRLTQVVEALFKFRDQGSTSRTAHSLDELWDQAAQPLNDTQRAAVDRFIGVTQEPEPQGDIGRDLGVHASTISLQCTEGLTRLVDAALADVVDAVEQVLDARGGIALLADVGERLEDQWVPGMVRGAGLVRLLTKTHNTRIQSFLVDGVDGPVVARPRFDKAAVRAFVGEVHRLAGQWPPLESESARRTLAAALPEYQGDPLQLATRLCTDVDFTEGGQLFIHPLEPIQSIGFVLDREREGFLLDDLKARVRQVFGERCPFPEPDHLLEVLRRLECQVQDGRVVPSATGKPRSVTAPSGPASDHVPPLLMGDRPAELVLRELLRDAATSRGFRMLVTPPEKHADISRSVATALGGRFVSFEDAFFRRHGDDIAALERAEQYSAQRILLTEYADDLLRDLLEEHGQPGRVVVLGDTALLGLCGALDAPRRLYDVTLSGSEGFWVLVLPGVIHNRQPLFNEGLPVWHLEGVTFPLLEPMPPSAGPVSESM
jgi:serine/threonine protein kinase